MNNPTRRFNIGDRVMVRVDSNIPYHRTPAYIQGKTGKVEIIYGSYRNPEKLAYGNDEISEQFLYQVSFLQLDVWQGDRYNGLHNDTVCVDLYDHWLEIDQEGRLV